MADGNILIPHQMDKIFGTFYMRFGDASSKKSLHSNSFHKKSSFLRFLCNQSPNIYSKLSQIIIVGLIFYISMIYMAPFVTTRQINYISILITSLILGACVIHYRLLYTQMITCLQYTPPLTPRYAELEELGPLKNTPIDKQIIGINGTWYNISKMISVHPGGEIICDYFGRDATVCFKLWHSYGNGNDVLNTYLKSGLIKKVGTYKLEIDGLDKMLLRQHVKLVNQGRYQTNYQWLLKKILIALSLYVAVYIGVVYTLKHEYVYLKYVFAVLLSVAWQQSGFLMHDAKHNILCTDKGYRWINYVLGLLFSDILFGVNSRHWYENHNLHHVFTNTIDNNGYYVYDKQGHEAIWFNNKKQFNLKGDTFRKFGRLQQFLLKYQGNIFLPALFLLGRIGIVVDSWRMERNVIHLSCLFIHLYGYYKYLYLLFEDNTSQFYTFYLISMLFQGVLHLQLLVSHYDKPWNNVDQHIDNGWFKSQSYAVKDIKCPWYLDWFFGGLQFHFVHHVLPKLPRHSYRDTSDELKALLRQNTVNNFEIEKVSFGTAIIDTVCHLRNVSIEYGAWNVMKESMYTGEIPSMPSKSKESYR